MPDQPTLVLLPGMDGTGRLFRWLVPEIRSTIRTIVVDYPADRFLNYAQLVDYVEQRLPTGPHVILAESFSGPVAVTVAARRPPRLCGLILSTSFVASPAPRSINWLQFGLLFRIKPPHFLLKRLLLDALCKPNVVTEVAAAIRAVSPDVLKRRLVEILAADATDALRDCPVPMLYLAASRDRLIGQRGLGAMRRVRSEIESVTLDGPHLLLQARPHEAAAVINQWLDQWFGIWQPDVCERE